MKKVILGAAALLAMTIGAKAQSTEFRSEDEADINLTAYLPNWIDIDPEVTNFTQNLNTNGSNWSTLENGWNFGTANFTVSASRKAQIRISATAMNMTGTGSPAPGTYGYTIPVGRLSADVTGYSGGVNSSVWHTVTAFDVHSGNNLSTSLQQVAYSDFGSHNVTFTLQLAAYKCNGCSNTTYYSDNLVGSLTNPYQGDIDFLASLVNP